MLTRCRRNIHILHGRLNPDQQSQHPANHIKCVEKDTDKNLRKL